MTKPFYQSKTIWANIIAVLAVSFGFDVGAELQSDIVVVVMGVINVILRGATKMPIVIKSLT